MSKVRCEMIPNATFDYHSSSVELHHLVLLPKTICEIVIMGLMQNMVYYKSWAYNQTADSLFGDFDNSHDIMWYILYEV